MQEEAVAPAPASYLDFPHQRYNHRHRHHHQGDEAAGPGGGRLHTRLFQQSVTMTAKMWPDDGEGTAAPGASGGGWRWGAWRVPAEYLPLLVGTVCGGALLLLLLAAAVVWRCCVVPRRDKAYCARLAEEMAARQRGAAPVLPSHSAVYATPKSGHWAYSSRLVGPPPAPAPAAAPSPGPGAAGPPPGGRWLCPAPHAPTPDHRPEQRSLPRSASYGHGHACDPGPGASGSDKHHRPASQLMRFGPCDPMSSEARGHQLPEISEFTPPTNQYASSSILDEVGARGEPSSGSATLKTRSLPAWVRSRSRPLSTEDDLAELYAKVNFSKKRKNRMRNDEAAIIALSKSRSQYLHKDTDSLVNNEAVIVYDERTAL